MTIHMTARPSLLAALILIAAGCGEDTEDKAPASANEEIPLVQLIPTTASTGDDDTSIHYRLEVIADGLPPNTVYLLDLRALDDGSDQIELSKANGSSVALATRSMDGVVTLTSGSGLDATDAGGTINVDYQLAPLLPTIEWLLMDGAIIGQLMPPPDPELARWRDTLDLVHAFDAVPGSATTSTEQALRRSLPLGTFEQPAVFLATRPSGGGTTYAYTTYESRTTYPDGRVEEHTCRVCTPVATNAN